MVVVGSPGVPAEAYDAWTGRMAHGGRDVQFVAASCDATLDSLIADVIEVASHSPGELVLVGHGLGGTVAVMAAPQVSPVRLVLLAPVLGWKHPSKALEEAAAGGGAGVLEIAGGNCAFSPIGESAAQWVVTRTVPVALDQIDAPAWIGVSLGDNVASVEDVVPASRDLARRELVRFGFDHLNRTDFDHGQLLSHPVPIKAAVRALRGGWTP